MSDEALSKLLGRMAKDDVLLKEFCAAPAKVLKREGIKVPPEEIPPKIDQAEFSKRLKAAVASGAGRVNLARRMLGRPYGIEGEVAGGRGVGRALLLPTANLEIQNRVLPADGVYVTLTLVDGVWRRSVTNIGKRPTFGGDAESKVETHLIDFDGDLYGSTIRVRVLHRLRGERKFAGVDELRAQIVRDREQAIRYFGSSFVKRNLNYS